MRTPTEEWMPDAILVLPISYRGNVLRSWEKIILHTTESSAYSPNRSSYFGHQLWPTFTFGPKLINNKFQWVWWQHLPLNHSAAAMRNLPGGVQTNNDGCIQIEIVWRAADGDVLPRQALDSLKKGLLWICSTTGIPYSFVDDFHYYPPENSHRLGKEPWRLQGSDWDNFRGICGHQHAPENVHGDPGKLDIPYLRTIDVKDVEMKNMIVSAITKDGVPYKAFIASDFSRVVEIPNDLLDEVKQFPDTVVVENQILTTGFLNRFNQEAYMLP